jgi:hypothetical protein
MFDSQFSHPRRIQCWQENAKKTLDDIEFIYSHQIPIVAFHHRSPFFPKKSRWIGLPMVTSPRRHGTMAHGGAGADGG